MQFGGFLKPNAAKVLNVMAWHAYDPPHGPKGPKEQPAGLFFQSAEKTCQLAFGKPMPPAPTSEKTEWTMQDRADHTERRTIYSTLTAAIRDLTDAGIITRKLNAKPGVRPAHFELHLERLQQASTENLMRATDTRKPSHTSAGIHVGRDEKIPSRRTGNSSHHETRKTRLVSRADENSPSRETRKTTPNEAPSQGNPVSRDGENYDHTNKGDFQVPTSIGEFQESPKATTPLAPPKIQIDEIEEEPPF